MAPHGGECPSRRASQRDHEQTTTRLKKDAIMTAARYTLHACKARRCCAPPARFEMEEPWPKTALSRAMPVSSTRKTWATT